MCSSRRRRQGVRPIGGVSGEGRASERPPGSRKTGEGLREPPALGGDDRPPRRRLRLKEGESVLLRFFLLLLFSGTLLLFVAEVCAVWSSAACCSSLPPSCLVACSDISRSAASGRGPDLARTTLRFLYSCFAATLSCLFPTFWTDFSPSLLAAVWGTKICLQSIALELPAVRMEEGATQRAFVPPKD